MSGASDDDVLVEGEPSELVHWVELLGALNAERALRKEAAGNLLRLSERVLRLEKASLVVEALNGALVEAKDRVALLEGDLAKVDEALLDMVKTHRDCGCHGCLSAQNLCLHRQALSGGWLKGRKHA